MAHRPVACRLTLPLALPLVLSLAGPLAAQDQPFVTLSDAIEAIRAGEPLQGRVSPALAKEAVERLASGRVIGARAWESAQVARAGRQVIPLARALAQSIATAAQPPTGAVRALAELSASVQDFALVRARRGLSPKQAAAFRSRLVRGLLRVAREPGPAAEQAAALLGRVATGDDVQRWVTRWSATETARGRERALLEALASRRPLPAGLLVAVQALPDVGAAHPALERLVARLASDEATAEELLLQVTLGRFGPRAVLLRCVDRLPPALWPKASQRALANVGAGDPDVAIAAVLAAARLRRPELLDRLEALLQDESDEVRAAALTAYAEVGYPDQPTVTLLIGFLDHPVDGVRAAAHATLVTLTTQRLAGVPALWQQWAQRADLPLEPPESPTQRLERLRAAQARAWTPAR